MPVSARRKMFFTSWKRSWTALAICRTSTFFWTGVGKTDARCPETLAFSVGQTTAEVKAYRERYARNLTLSRLSEAVILPLSPDKGACLSYDPNLPASACLENDLKMLLRMRDVLE